MSDAPGRAAAMAATDRADPGGGDARLRGIGRSHFRATHRASDDFFRERADAISEACWDMARRFHRGGRLLVFAPPGPVRSDAYHVSVEFVHPVLVGKRALPAATLAGDQEARIRAVGRPEDIAAGIAGPGGGGGVADGLRAAADAGLLTVGLSGGGGGRVADLDLDHTFVIPSDDPFVVQEVQETLYHVLWELVHVFFDHEGLL